MLGRNSRYGGSGVLDWSGPRAGGAPDERLDALEIAAFRPGPQEFAEARSFRKIALAEVTGTLPAGVKCRGSCSELVAIECTR